MEVKYFLKVYILAQGAEIAPPLGTILGNLGVNSINFCKDFNSFTEDLPNFLTLRVKILIYSNKSYKFIIEGLPFTPLLNLYSFERMAWIKGKKINQRCLTVKHLIQLTQLLFPGIILAKILPIALGTIKSCGLTII